MAHSPISALRNILSPGVVQKTTIKPGPVGNQHATAIVLGDMTRIPADAYVVPHFQNAASPGGVGGAVARSGARSGWIAYDRYVRGLTGKQEFGSAIVTDSGGGNSQYLINVVSVASGDLDAELRTASLSTANALQAAAEAQMQRIVFPALGTGVIGRLNSGQSARAILGALYTFWNEHPDIQYPNQVVVAIYGDTGAYDSFSDVLETGVLTADAARVDAGTPKKFSLARWFADVTGGMQTEDWLKGKED